LILLFVEVYYFVNAWCVLFVKFLIVDELFVDNIEANVELAIRTIPIMFDGKVAM